MMAMTYQVDEDNSVIEIHIGHPVPVKEQQKILAEMVATVSQVGISKWLFVFSTTEQQNSEQARRFTEFVFHDLKKYIGKVAVVCDPVLNSRATEVLAPIKNQENPVGVFSSEEAARIWLNE